MSSQEASVLEIEPPKKKIKLKSETVQQKVLLQTFASTVFNDKSSSYNRRQNYWYTHAHRQAIFTNNLKVSYGLPFLIQNQNVLTLFF